MWDDERAGGRERRGGQYAIYRVANATRNDFYIYLISGYSWMPSGDSSGSKVPTERERENRRPSSILLRLISIASFRHNLTREK